MDGTLTSALDGGERSVSHFRSFDLTKINISIFYFVCTTRTARKKKCVPEIYISLSSSYEQTSLGTTSCRYGERSKSKITQRLTEFKTQRNNVFF